LKAVLDALLTSLETLVPYDTANVMLRCSETEVTALYSKGYENWTDVSIIPKIVFDIREKAHLRKIIEEKESVILEDVSRAPDWELTPGTEHVACWLGVPLIAGGEVIGFFSLDKAEPGFFNEEHLRLVEALSAQAAAAIKNAQLYEEIQYYAAELERRVEERTAELVQINQELEAFSYSVSHDLRAPLRAIDGFSRILAEDYGNELDEEARRLIGVVRSNAQRMGQLIDDLLSFSRVGRKALLRSEIDMVNLAHSIYYEVTDEKQREKIEFILQDLPPALADASLLRQVFTNLLSNAVKFSSTKEAPKIEVGFSVEDGETVYYVRDNGVGFEMNYAHKLFQIFQRLHSQEEFEGTGVGLSIVQRIIVRHGGRVWAESELGQGATFYFSLPSGKPS
ncbi:MAG: GAF domain-containing protein, partial [Chloroflexi bacterium]|nr:GAF domain-containing protein [Chloroflexota bacterium]